MSSEIITQLEQEATKRMYERLIAVHDKSKTANENIIKDLEGSRMFQEVFCCNDPIYNDQLAVIKETMPVTINSDTVGEYLYGCFQPETNVEISCTPACADNSLKNPNLPPCDLASFEKKGILRRLNNIVSKDAHLFIAHNNVVTQDDIVQLYNNGVKNVITYTQDGNSINYILGEVNVIKEPSINSTSTPTPNSNSNSIPTQSFTDSNDDDTTNSSWSWLWILVFIVLIIIIIIAVVNLR
jgi:hypothetical protein